MQKSKLREVRKNVMRYQIHHGKLLHGEIQYLYDIEFFLYIKNFHDEFTNKSI